MSYELVELLRLTGRPRLLVVGDLVLDRYTWADAERISQEAPVMLLREDKQEVRLGGAANVANMLAGLDAEVQMAGLVGADQDGREMQDLLEAAGVKVELVDVDPRRPTTVKTRVIGRAQQRHPHQVLRIDRESREPMCQSLADPWLRRLREALADVDAVLISDYAKGVCTPVVLETLIESCRDAGLPVIVDPASGRDYSVYARATAITPNRSETAHATGRTVDSIEAGLEAAACLCRNLDLETAFVTLDSDGIAWATSAGERQHSPTRRREVYDITGAGDVVLATIGLSAAAGHSPEQMAMLANTAGGLEVEQIGVVTISRAEMISDLLGGSRSAREKLRDRGELVELLAVRRDSGQRVVLTNGCFDLMHAGHVASLEQAAAEGDCLVVAVNSDTSVRQLGKGPDRPIIPEDQRATMLAALEVVDYVTIFDEATPAAVIEALRPDVLVKGGTYSLGDIVGRQQVEDYGGVVKPLGLVPGLSTSEIISRIRNLQESADDESQESRRRAG